MNRLDFIDLQSAFDRNKIEKNELDNPPQENNEELPHYDNATLAIAHFIDRFNNFNTAKLSGIELEEQKVEKRMACIEYLMGEVTREAEIAKNKDDKAKKFEVSDELLVSILYFQNVVWKELQQAHGNKVPDHRNPFSDGAITEIHLEDMLSIVTRLESLMGVERRLVAKQGLAVKHVFEVQHLVSLISNEEIKNYRSLMKRLSDWMAK